MSQHCNLLCLFSLLLWVWSKTHMSLLLRVSQEIAHNVSSCLVYRDRGLWIELLSFADPLDKTLTLDQARIAARHACHRWLNLGTILLGMSSVRRVEDFVSKLTDDSTDADRFHTVVEAWIRKEGRKATLGSFLDACNHPMVDVRGDVEEALLKAGQVQ